MVAPAREQSGVGASLTLHSPVKVTPWTPDAEFQQSGDGVHPVTAYAAEGTPGDCCILALETLTTGVDLVVSGINSGSNCGWDVMVSGTVGGAVQGFNRGRNTIAVSVGSVAAPRYDVAGPLLEGLARRLSQREGGPLFLNLNVPNVAPELVKGIKATRLGGLSYRESVAAGNHRWRRKGLPHRPQPPRQPGTVRRLRHHGLEEQLRLHHTAEAGHGRRRRRPRSRGAAGRVDLFQYSGQRPPGIMLFAIRQYARHLFQSSGWETGRKGGDMTTMTNEERLGRLEAELAGTNRRLDDTNVRLSETNARLDKVIFMLFGIGAGVIATLVTVIFTLITND